MNYSTKHFDDLTLQELYDILKLRSEVFVVEQNCVYQDLDDKDKYSHHVLGKNPIGKIEAYARLIPPGISYPDYSSIGRVVNCPQVRGTGEGKRLMYYSIEKILTLWPDAKIKISAQSHLDKFYSELGFTATGEEYLEDGIPHMAMIYN